MNRSSFSKTVSMICGFVCAGAAALADVNSLQLQEPDVAQRSTDQLVAQVGEIEITLGHLVAATADLNAQDLENTPEDIINGLINQLVKDAMMAQSVEEWDILGALQLENFERMLLARQAKGTIFDRLQVSDAEVEQAYNERILSTAPPAEFNAAHILVPTLEEAEAVITVLAEGSDFAELAMEKSIGPSAPNGGELGWLPATRMVPEFAQTVLELEPGEMSEPVETQFGWHVIKLIDSRFPGIPSLEDAAPALRYGLQQERYTAEVSTIMDGLEVVQYGIGGIDPAELILPLTQG